MNLRSARQTGGAPPGVGSKSLSIQKSSLAFSIRSKTDTARAVIAQKPAAAGAFSCPAANVAALFFLVITCDIA